MLAKILAISFLFTSTSPIPWNQEQSTALRKPTSSATCRPNEVQLDDGTCTLAEVSQNIFFVTPPHVQMERRKNPIDLPNPKLHYNVVFVKAPEDPEGPDPIVVPPPQQKTLLYVLNKYKEKKESQIIQVPMSLEKPEVIFVNYMDGENPQLPIGIDLETALKSVQTLEGKVVEKELINSIPSNGEGAVAEFIPTKDLGKYRRGMVGKKTKTAVTKKQEEIPATPSVKESFSNEDSNGLFWESSKQSYSSYSSPT